MAATPLRKRLRRLEVRLQRNPRLQRLLRAGFSRYMRFVTRTSRWTCLGLEAWGPEGNRDPVVMCTWHSHLSMALRTAGLTGRHVAAMVSDHADGQLVVDYLRDLGLEPIPVSTSRSKTQSLRASLAVLRRGDTVGLVTDGPMGPPRKSKQGAVLLASLSGVPIVPLGYAARPVLRLPTWDRFILPLPWGRAVLSAGPPLMIARGLDAAGTEAALARLDAAIDAEIARCEAALRR